MSGHRISSLCTPIGRARAAVAWAAISLGACGGAPDVVTSPVLPPPAASSAQAADAGDGPLAAPPPRLVAVAGATTCVVRGGRVHCFGNPVGSTAFPHDPAASATPRPVDGIEDAVGVALARDHACALLRGGTAVCWGVVDDGKSGHTEYDHRPHYVLRRVESPEPVPGLSRATALAADAGATCALLEGGAVACWGMNDRGALGDGSSPGHLDARPVPRVDDAVDLASGGGRFCAVRRSSEVWCWAGAEKAEEARPHAVPQLAGAKRVAVGTDGACAILPGGGLRCMRWTSDPREPPTLIADAHAVEVALGESHRCAILADGAVRCDGRASSGQLGDGIVGNWEERGGVVQDERDAIALAGDSDHACAVQRSGTVRCWGHNGAGQCGQPFRVVVPSPTRVEGLADVVHVAMGQRAACALRKDGAVLCWGAGDGGALGGGTRGATVFDPPVDRATPRPVDRLPAGAKAIVGGGSHFCVLHASGRVTCWGEYGLPRTCQNLDKGCYQPETIAGLTDAVELGATVRTTCAVRRTGALACWGFALDGTPMPSGGMKPPGLSVIPGASGVAHASLGTGWGCVARHDGTAACFGGDADAALRQRNWKQALVEVRGAHDVAFISHGLPRYVLYRNGEVRAFARGFSFDADPEHKRPPTLSPPDDRVLLRDVAQLVQHDSETCARLRSGQLVCSGPGSAPAPSGVDDAVDVALSEQGARCAVRKNGEVVCWGENGSGECGVEPGVIVPAPREVAGLPPP